MNTICFFSSYFTQRKIPYYIIYYLENLKPFFTKIIFITNEKTLDAASLQFLKNNNIELLFVINEGYDFGMWHKGIESVDISQYNKICLVNDSCILFTSLEKFMAWADKNESDFIGISQSTTVSRHLQSYFLIIKSKAIPTVIDYFKQTGVLNLYKDVIKKYEVGLSTYLLQQGFKIASYVDNDNYEGEFSPYYKLIESHIKQGVPMIKKKIIYMSYRQDELFTLARMSFNIFPDYYINMINQYHSKNNLIDFEKVKTDNKIEMNFLDRIIYNSKKLFIRLIRKIK